MRLKIRNVFISILFLLSVSLFSLAKEDQDPFYVKIPKFETPPKIDGVLDNPLWLNTAVLENFTQFQPVGGNSGLGENDSLYGLTIRIISTLLFVALIQTPKR